LSPETTSFALEPPAVNAEGLCLDFGAGRLAKALDIFGKLPFVNRLLPLL
jgi:hypothetical protein